MAFRRFCETKPTLLARLPAVLSYDSPDLHGDGTSIIGGQEGDGVDVSQKVAYA